MIARSLGTIRSGMLGLLVGDALGVPYEFHAPGEIPAWDEIEMVPPPGYPRSYSHVPVGTWSDDGAQALCLLVSLSECRGWNAEDFVQRLLAWYRGGEWAVDGKVFDIGIQTATALNRLASGVPSDESGLGGERNNGNGSLMRTLPVALLGPGDDVGLVELAHAQSLVTHAHPRSQACCALFALWARREMGRVPDPWLAAVEALRDIYRAFPVHLTELEENILSWSGPCSGSGYVVDALHSARAACGERDYEAIVRAAVAFGNDTDTTACVAGGIAGLRHGEGGIPPRWLAALRGREILDPILARFP